MLWHGKSGRPKAVLELTDTAREQLVRWERHLTDDLLRRSDHRSVQVLEKDIRAWVQASSENPPAIPLDQDRGQVLESLSRLLRRITGAGH